MLARWFCVGLLAVALAGCGSETPPPVSPAKPGPVPAAQGSGPVTPVPATPGPGTPAAGTPLARPLRGQSRKRWRRLR